MGEHGMIVILKLGFEYSGAALGATALRTVVPPPVTATTATSETTTAAAVSG